MRPPFRWRRWALRRAAQHAQEGGRATDALAAIKLDKMLGDYQQPYLDPAIDEALKAYMAEKKASMPDAFM